MMGLGRLLFLVILAATVGGILAWWHHLVGFDARDGRWWVWLWQSLLHPEGLPDPLTRAAWTGGVAGLMAMALTAALLGRAGNVTRAGGVKTRDLHGTARWATTRDVRRAGLLGRRGVVVGGWKRPLGGARPLRHDGPEHVLCFAPTRSGKGVSLILPTLLTWPESVLVLDIKGENHALSAGYRASLGHTVLAFDPTDPRARVRINPLAEIRLGTGQEIRDCQNIATMIIDPDGRGLKDYWMKEGFAWLSTALLHVLYRRHREGGDTACLADVNAVLSGIGADADGDDEDRFLDLLRDMAAFEHGDPVIDAEVRRGAHRMMLKAVQERSGVHSSAITGMALFADPIIARNTASSSFAVADLMHGARPAALYLMVPPSDIDRLRPLIRILMSLVLRRLTETMAFENGAPVKHYTHRLLLMLDEFTAVGKLDVMEKGLAYMAGYGLKAVLIVQDIAQLHQTYGRDESLTGNCHIRVAFAPNRLETAEHLSRLAGKATVIQARRSRSGRLGERHSVSDSQAEVARPLLTADEALRLGGLRTGRRGRVIPGEALIFAAGSPPMRGVQTLYFQDKTLRRRARLAPPEPPSEPPSEPAPATDPIPEQGHPS